MKILYKFEWDCRRMGQVEGIFVSDEATINKYIGSDVYFGEILGKHSEIYGTLDERDITVVSKDQEKIEWLIDTVGQGSHTISGYNPLDYLYEDEDDEEYDT